MHKPNFSKNKALKITLIILGVLLVIGILYAGVQVYRGKGIGFESRDLDLSSRKPEIDPETGWKIYKNEEYGFEVMYPPEFSVVDWAQKAGNHDLLIYIGENSDIGDGPVSIGLEKGINSFDEYFQKKNYSPNYWEKFEDIEVGSEKYKAKRYSEKVSYDSEKYSGDLDYVNYLIEHSDRLFSIHYNRKQKAQISEEEFQQMLSSFRFY